MILSFVLESLPLKSWPFSFCFTKMDLQAEDEALKKLVKLVAEKKSSGCHEIDAAL